MALLSADVIVGLLFAFIQFRLRSIFSLSSYILKDLVILLPPDAVEHSNGKQEALQLKWECIRATDGTFQRIAYYDMYESFVIMNVSLIAAALSQYLQSQFTTAPSTASYGLWTLLLIALMFPIQMNRLQFSRVGTYDTQQYISIGISVLGFILSLFVIFAPPFWFDFNMENCIQMLSERVDEISRQLKLQPSDSEKVFWTHVIHLLAVILTSAFAALLAFTSFEPALQMAKFYHFYTRKSTASIGYVRSLLLALNLLLPLLVNLSWLSFISIVAQRFMDQSTWHRLRIALVLTLVLFRVFLFRFHSQWFLLEPRSTSLPQVNAQLSLARIQANVKLHYNFLPMFVVQYLALSTALLAVSFMWKTEFSLREDTHLQFKDSDRNEIGFLIRKVLQFTFISPSAYQSLVGFSIWWMTSVWMWQLFGAFCYCAFKSNGISTERVPKKKLGKKKRI